MNSRVDLPVNIFGRRKTQIIDSKKFATSDIVRIGDKMSLDFLNILHRGVNLSVSCEYF